MIQSYLVKFHPSIYFDDLIVFVCFFFKLDVMTKWSHLQTIANEKDDQLNQNRQQWKDFKIQLDDLEQAAEQFTNLDNLCQLNNLLV